MCGERCVDVDVDDEGVASILVEVELESGEEDSAGEEVDNFTGLFVAHGAAAASHLTTPHAHVESSRATHFSSHDGHSHSPSSLILVTWSLKKDITRGT